MQNKQGLRETYRRVIQEYIAMLGEGDLVGEVLQKSEVRNPPSGISEAMAEVADHLRELFRVATPLNLVITVNLWPPLTLSLFLSPVFLRALLSVIVATEEDESPNSSAQPLSPFGFLSLSLEVLCTRWLSSSDTSILEMDRQKLLRPACYNTTMPQPISQLVVEQTKSRTG
uniref:Uncharacterized protein n=1 Tax=Glossina austeni TaxID=7395 RepID=A0A1A9VVR0_GLOAU